MSDLVVRPPGQFLVSAPARPIDDPRPELRMGAIVAAAFFVVFLGWAALAPLDAAVFASGQLQVSGQRQAVQHRDGGIVAAARVHEGQKVNAGDVLIELAGPEVRAQAQALGSQMINLLAQRQRLEAEQLGLARVAWPASFVGIDLPAAELRAAMAVQDRELAARRSLLSAQSRVLDQQNAQSRATAGGFGSQVNSMTEQERLIGEEISSLAPLAEQGFVSKSRLRSLERARAELRGQGGQFRASAAAAQLASGASTLKQLEAQKAYRERASTELRDVVFGLSELTPKYFAARDELRRLQVRAPASGTVVGLNVFTVGGVIAAGQRLMDIVPDHAELVVGARVAPDDADDIAVGQAGELRMVGMHDRSLPILSATMTRLSADVMIDEKSGVAFYNAEFKVPASELAKIREVRGANFTLRAGAPVQVVMPIRKRTALEYAFEPLSRIAAASGTEH